MLWMESGKCDYQINQNIKIPRIPYSLTEIRFMGSQDKSNIIYMAEQSRQEDRDQLE
jgi:hypothetical protein